MERGRYKFSFERPAEMDEGVKLCVEAYRYMKQNKTTKIEALDQVWNYAAKRYGKRMPGNEGMVDYITKIDTFLTTGENIQAGRRRSAKDAIINSAVNRLRELGYGKQEKQTRMELEPEEKHDSKQIIEQVPEEQKKEPEESVINLLVNGIIQVIRNGVTITIKPISNI